MEQDGELAAAEGLDAHLALRLEILADRNAAVEAELVGRRDVRVVVPDANDLRTPPEQAALAGPVAEALEGFSDLLIRANVSDEGEAHWLHGANANVLGCGSSHGRFLPLLDGGSWGKN